MVALDLEGAGGRSRDRDLTRGARLHPYRRLGLTDVAEDRPEQKRRHAGNLQRRGGPAAAPSDPGQSRARLRSRYSMIRLSWATQPQSTAHSTTITWAYCRRGRRSSSTRSGRRDHVAPSLARWVGVGVELKDGCLNLGDIAEKANVLIDGLWPVLGWPAECSRPPRCRACRLQGGKAPHRHGPDQGRRACPVGSRHPHPPARSVKARQSCDATLPSFRDLAALSLRREQEPRRAASGGVTSRAALRGLPPEPRRTEPCVAVVGARPGGACGVPGRCRQTDCTEAEEHRRAGARRGRRR